MAVLFISRGTVSGVRILIDCLRKRTEIKCLSREDLVKEVSQYGEWATTAVQQISKATAAYDYFSRVRRFYIVLMRQALLKEIQMGALVYYGFAGHLLVPHLDHFVRVRINAPLGLRIPMTMERLECDEESAQEYIRTSDEHQVRWARFVYGYDIRDPALYDLNINLGHLRIEAVCGILKHILREDDLWVSDESRVQIERLLLSANVEAALVIDPRTRELEIEAKGENGRIHLNGPYLKKADLAVVTEIAGAIEGVEKVDYSPGYVSQHRFEELEDNIKLKL